MLVYKMPKVKEGQKVLFYDTETTGLNHATGSVVQFTGIMGVRKNGKYEITEVYNTYIHPEMPVDPSAAAVTGLTEEFLADKPEEEDVFSKIYELFESADYICGHNILTFDNKWMADMYARNGHPGSFWKDEISIDTLKLARELIPREKAYKQSHKLCDMMEYYKLTVDGDFHDALTDVKSCILVLEELEKDYAKAEKEEEKKPKMENANIQVKVYSVVPWMAKFPGAYQKANYLFVNTNCGKWRFNRYNYSWQEVEKEKPASLENVIKATYAFCNIPYGDEGELAHWKG